MPALTAVINTTPPPFSRRPYTPAFTDQDFYCSFTHLPCAPAINLDELPFTIHSPYRSHLPALPLPGMFGSPRSNSTSTTHSARSSLRSFLSTTSSTSTSSRRHRLFSKVRQPFGMIFSSTRRKSHATTTTAAVLMKTSRKPSTLDFRCIGAENAAAAASRLDLGRRDGWQAPRLDWAEPTIIGDGWEREGWFEGI